MNVNGLLGGPNDCLALSTSRFDIVDCSMYVPQVSDVSPTLRKLFTIMLVRQSTISMSCANYNDLDMVWLFERRLNR